MRVSGLAQKREQGMAISRRDLVKAGVVAGSALGIPAVLLAQTKPTAAQTVRMVKGTDLRIFDPVVSYTTITQDHALAIYDTLFSLDSKFLSRPQMVGKWGVSDDKKTYTFELRDGLGWHDGTAVTAADCVASIRRWAQIAPGGQLIMARLSDMSKKSDTTFTIALKEPLELLTDLLAGGLFVMREKDANRPATEQVTANIGSGPYKFNEALAKPGASFTYDRNEKYVPRNEPPDGYAGGKIVKVNRVIWDNIADRQTSLAALQSGEVDYFETPPADLYSVIEADPNLELEILNKSGYDLFLRINCLQKPFDNVKARQAMLHLIDQEAFMRAAIGNPKYFKTMTSWFGNETPYTNDENTGWYKKGGDPERAKQLFQEAGYAGEKVVILDATNFPIFDNCAQLLVATLRKIGINAELAPSDWGGIVVRRAKKEPVEDGGWSIFITSGSDYSRSQPVANITMVANGESAWYGWPNNDEYEALRAKWSDAGSLDERKALARKMQQLYWESVVGSVLLGQYSNPIARRKTLTGLIAPLDSVAMWNLQKA